jgi:hypothetical protein
MVSLLADQNFDERIITGLLRRLPHLDIIRARDVALSRAVDRDVLTWAAGESRVVLTHDVRTMTRYFNERIASGVTAPGMVEVPDTLSVGRAVTDLVVLLECTRDDEWENQIHYLPL